MGNPISAEDIGRAKAELEEVALSLVNQFQKNETAVIDLEEVEPEVLIETTIELDDIATKIDEIPVVSYSVDNTYD